MTVKNCDFQGWYEGLSPIEKAAWDMKFDEASQLVFGEVIRIATNKKNKTREITDFFSVVGK